tara:strand:- start:3099 stop:3680 length:582 start_codon:yes stop_codon:yes gene_type:complete
MIPNIRSPKAGEPIPVKWGQDVARAIKSLTDQLVQYPMSRDDGGGSAVCTELAASLSGTALSVTLGYTNNMIPEIGGDPLNNDPIPTLTVSGATTLWLLIDWDVVLTGTAPTKTIASTTAENARFVLATSQTEILPSTDGTTATDGLQAVRWGEITSDGAGGYIYTAVRCGSNQVSYCDGLGGYLVRYERLAV